uniref:Uncharacterized protein n=1 Tax=Timema cristinae TaxID=61476 RepID=A0A7R9DH97_TIMCR|nr:unnamed protein product [Timema cristinae]
MEEFNYILEHLKTENGCGPKNDLVEQNKVDINTEEDIAITIKSELENYKSCSVKLERLSDGFLSVLERIKTALAYVCTARLGGSAFQTRLLVVGESSGLKPLGLQATSGSNEDTEWLKEEEREKPIEFDTYTKEDMGATIKSEIENNKSCFVKLERLSDDFLTFEKIIKVIN